MSIVIFRYCTKFYCISPIYCVTIIIELLVYQIKQECLIMKIEEIKKNAFAMPYASPSALKID